MESAVMNSPRLVGAGLAAGVWVTASGMLMAAVFGYREMKVAFEAVGLPIRQGVEPLVVHTFVRIALGFLIVALYAILVAAFIGRLLYRG